MLGLRRHHGLLNRNPRGRVTFVRERDVPCSFVWPSNVARADCFGGPDRETIDDLSVLTLSGWDRDRVALEVAEFLLGIHNAYLED